MAANFEVIIKSMRQLISFIRNTRLEPSDSNLQTALKEAIADLFASTLAGAEAPVSGIVKRFAAAQYGSGNCTLFMSPDKLTPAGAALVNGTIANALDVDDGHRLTKGHPGAVIFPAILAAAEQVGATGRQFMDAMLAGYEVAIRAGILAHQLRPEYHCTGSWGAIGAAAGVGKLLGLTDEQMEHALGIAEYQSTYSPMMRCIDVPSMLKDGIAWGSMTGLSAAYLAREGFTGIPSLFDFEEAREIAGDIGERYRVLELYFKPYTCCRWAQPSIEAMKEIARSRDIRPESIDSITIHTFEESSRLLKSYPENTEEAQYNLFYPLASYLVFGNVGPREILHELHNPVVRSLIDRMNVQIDPEIDAQFPGKALSRLEIRLTNGEVLRSGTCQARGDFDYPLTSDEKRDKYFRLTVPVLGDRISEQLYDGIFHLPELDDIRKLTVLLQGGPSAAA